MAALLNHLTLADEAAWIAALEQYTCPNDGYVRIKRDAHNPALAYYLPTCPIDPLIPTLTAVITTQVTQAVATQAAANPFDRLANIIEQATLGVTAYGRQHLSDEEIINFVLATNFLRPRIIAELETQGIIA